MEHDLLTSSFLGLRDKLHRIALDYLKSDEEAKDALQDTWLRLRDRGGAQSEDEARNKLVAVLRHLCIDRLRKARTDRVVAAKTFGTKGYYMEEENLPELERLLQEGLTPLQKEIFDLTLHEGLEYEQVAERLSMTVEAVRMNMSRARKKIRETYNRLNR